MKILRLLIFSIVLFTLGSCQNDNDTILVEGNIAPPDPTIERVLVEGYVNKLYISLLGREPSTIEFNQALNLLGELVNEQELKSNFP